jgi:hypothetical protein
MISNKLQLPVLQKRRCDGCTKCCEGWLSGNVYGHEMFTGRKCHFLEKQCTIYDSRPENPCQTYECAWLNDQSIPGWMKPDLSNVIISKRIERSNKLNKNIEFYQISEAGSRIDVGILNWVIHWAIQNNLNITYQIDGKFHTLGSPEFNEYATSTNRI